jgi:alpha-amylase
MRQLRLTIVALVLNAGLLWGGALAATGEDWRSRTVFQIVTDRFATDGCLTEVPCDVNGYCGGTYAGMQKMLPYVKDLGFDAIWMSPFAAQGVDAFNTSVF